MNVRATTAILCDAATVREGLLHLLGGGVSALGRPSFPAPLLVDLALVLEFNDLNADTTTHLLRVDLSIPVTGVAVSSLEMTYTLDAASNHAYQEVVLAVPISNLGVPEPGDYNVVVTCDSFVIWRKGITAYVS